MASRMWREIVRGALAGAAAGAALSMLGLRLGSGATLQPAPEPAPADPEPFDVPPSYGFAPAAEDRRARVRAVLADAAAGASLGALHAWLRLRLAGAPGRAETQLYGLLLSTLGLAGWAAPLGLASLADEDLRDRLTTLSGEETVEGGRPPYEVQPPWDDRAPFDAF